MRTNLFAVLGAVDLFGGRAKFIIGIHDQAPFTNNNEEHWRVDLWPAFLVQRIHRFGLLTIQLEWLGAFICFSLEDGRDK